MARSYIWMSVGFLLVVNYLHLTLALVPSLCMRNATSTPEAVCCPVPPGFREPCGGPGRGSCKYLKPTNEHFSPIYTEFSHDNRLDWPRRFFTHACRCEGNFMGYMCQECKWGYRGRHCMQRHLQVRKDALTLSAEEKKEFRDVVNLAKHSPSDWMVPTAVYDMDTQQHLHFMNVSVYDFIVYQHVFSGRQTTALDGHKMTGCRTELASYVHYDFAHNGMGFLPWHRLFLLRWERELQQLANNPDFTIPYWDWVGVGNHCAVCVNDLVGATNPLSPEGLLQRESPFHDWVGICQDEADMQGCRYCDPTVPGRRLTRDQRNTLYPTAPTYEDMAFAQQFSLYSTEPYGINSTESFANSLEGFLSQHGLFCHTGNWNNHNVIHAIFNGYIFDVTTSPNDPLFILLHNNIDRLLEKWLREHPDHMTELTDSGAPAGHNLQSPLVPFFPREIQSDYHQVSLQLGYDFDTLSIMARTDPNHGTRLTEQADISTDSSGLTSGSVAAIALTITMTTLILIAVFILRKRVVKSRTVAVQHEEEEDHLLM